MEKIREAIVAFLLWPLNQFQWYLFRKNFKWPTGPRTEEEIRLYHLECMTPIKYAYAYEPLDKIIELLKLEKDILDYSDENGWDILHLAIDRQDPEILKYTLSLGCDVNQRDRLNRTPLHRAAGRHSSECVKILLDTNADIHAINKDGQTALHHAAFGEMDPPDPNSYGYPEIVHALIDVGVDINAQDNDGRTALMLSVNTFGEVFDILLASKADITLQDNNGMDIMDYAVEEIHGDGNKIQVLFDGMLIKPDCLHRARRWNIDGMKKLIELGADVNALDEHGWTPLHVASLVGESSVVQCLLDHEVDVTKKILIPLIGEENKHYYALDVVKLPEDTKKILVDLIRPDPRWYESEYEKTEIVKSLTDAMENIRKGKK